MRIVHQMLDHSKPLVIEVRGDDPTGRLDTWLATRLNALSRREAQRMIEAGAIRVNGRRATKAMALFAGDSVEVTGAPAKARWTALADGSAPLDVVTENPRFLVVEKRSGVPTTPLRPDETGTLAGAVAARYPECAALGRSPGDSGLLQRLDIETSGLVVAARSAEVFEVLSRAQDSNRFEKRYLALVESGGRKIDLVVDQPLLPAGPRGRSMRVDPRGRPARTELKAVEVFGRWTLVGATIHRGARHQIRAHLAHLGLPISGDELYGGPRLLGLERLFLHCAEIRFPDPDDGDAVIGCASRLPEELLRPLETLRS